MTQRDHSPFDKFFKEALTTLTEEFAMEVRTIFLDQQFYLKLYDYEMGNIEDHFENSDKIIQVFLILEGIVKNYSEEFNATFTSHQRDMEGETDEDRAIRHIFYEYVKIFPALETKAQSFKESFFKTVANYRDATNWDRILLKERVRIFIRLKAVFRKYKGEFLKKFQDYQ